MTAVGEASAVDAAAGAAGRGPRPVRRGDPRVAARPVVRGQRRRRSGGVPARRTAPPRRAGALGARGGDGRRAHHRRAAARTGPAGRGRRVLGRRPQRAARAHAHGLPDHDPPRPARAQPRAAAHGGDAPGGARPERRGRRARRSQRAGDRRGSTRAAATSRSGGCPASSGWRPATTATAWSWPAGSTATRWSPTAAPEPARAHFPADAATRPRRNGWCELKVPHRATSVLSSGRHRPSSSTSMRCAAGTLGRPGIVMISPVTSTTNPAPAASRTSRTATVCPEGAPRCEGSVENDDWVLAMQIGRWP